MAVLTGFIIGSLNKIWPWKLTQSVFDKSSSSVVQFKDVSNLGSLSVYQNQLNDFENYKVALEKSISPFQYSEVNLGIDSQLIPAIILAIAGFALILLMEKLAVQKK